MKIIYRNVYRLPRQYGYIKSSSNINDSLKNTGLKKISRFANRLYTIIIASLIIIFILLCLGEAFNIPVLKSGFALLH